MSVSPVPLLRLDGVTHKYGLVTALWEIDLQVRRGDFIAIFGPNGAGKSTLLKVAAALIKPTRGRVIFEGPSLGRGQVGYVSHQSLLYNEMTGLENLVFYSRLYQLEEGTQRSRELLRQMGLESAADQMVRGYSRGMRQRLTLARALLHEPPLLLLDEPYTGLDQHGCRLLTAVLAQLQQAGRTVLLITHNLGEGLELSDRILIQNKGEIAYQAERGAMSRTELEQIYFDVVG